MSEKFDDVDQLKMWLIKSGIHPATVERFAKDLFENFYNADSSFTEGFRDNELEQIGLPAAAVKQFQRAFPGAGDVRKKREAVVGTIERDKKRQELSKYGVDSFHSPLDTRLPVVFEKERAEPFLAPKNWLSNSAKKVLEQANLEETNNPRVSPIALIRCSRGGKTRSMIELAKEVRSQDSSHGIVYMSFNTDTSLSEKRPIDPTGELCVRIAFAALKSRKHPSDMAGFLKFSGVTRVDKEWVIDWLGNHKCILFIDELNMLQDCIGEDTAVFLKQHFLLPAGRGIVFSSHVASLNHELAEYMSSPSDRKIVTIPLPIIPSLYEARENFDMPDLAVQDALFLGLLPGLIVERKRCRGPTQRRMNAVTTYLGTIRFQMDVHRLLKTLITGDVEGVDTSLQELMDADLKDDGQTMILRWIPFHMEYVIQQIAFNCPYVDDHMRKCLSGVTDLFRQLTGLKWQSGDSWEALFLIVLIVRCLTKSFDSKVVPLGALTSGDTHVDYNRPLNANVDFFQENDPLAFVGGIPLRSWAPAGTPAISIYYPGHARFEDYDIILAFWDSDGKRLLYGYQLKEGSTIPKAFPNNEHFHQSYLIRGAAKERNSSVRLWQSVSDSQLDDFFGVSAVRWSAKQWRKIQQTVGISTS
mmetsp:Transcript_28332/g.77783  ORF Transcript_28332/g.77783 Transcript_28332/m.77783 type:complete len:642 (+) Transcript_28332:160-2085(+)